MHDKLEADKLPEITLLNEEALAKELVCELISKNDTNKSLYLEEICQIDETANVLNNLSKATISAKYSKY